MRRQQVPPPSTFICPVVKYNVEYWDMNDSPKRREMTSEHDSNCEMEQPKKGSEKERVQEALLELQRHFVFCHSTSIQRKEIVGLRITNSLDLLRSVYRGDGCGKCVRESKCCICTVAVMILLGLLL